MTLAGLDFLQRGENIIFHGKTGVGKKWFGCGNFTPSFNLRISGKIL
jgi:hypothetical protein